MESSVDLCTHQLYCRDKRLIGQKDNLEQSRLGQSGRQYNSAACYLEDVKYFWSLQDHLCSVSASTAQTMRLHNWHINSSIVQVKELVWEDLKSRLCLGRCYSGILHRPVWHTFTAPVTRTPYKRAHKTDIPFKATNLTNSHCSTDKMKPATSLAG